MALQQPNAKGEGDCIPLTLEWMMVSEGGKEER